MGAYSFGKLLLCCSNILESKLSYFSNSPIYPAQSTVFAHRIVDMQTIAFYINKLSEENGWNIIQDIYQHWYCVFTFSESTIIKFQSSLASLRECLFDYGTIFIIYISFLIRLSNSCCSAATLFIESYSVQNSNCVH